MELAFVAALQHLSATQRAVLILRDVLGFSAREVAESLDTSVASVNSALQRARKAVAERLPERSQQETLRALGDERVRELVEAYIDAWERGDVDALRALLAEDAVFSMPPWPIWWRGRETIAGFAKAAWRLPRRRARCRSARTGSRRSPLTARRGDGALHGDGDRRLTLEGARIKEITAFVTPAIFARFGLPAELDRLAEACTRKVVVAAHARTDTRDIGPVDMDRDRSASRRCCAPDGCRLEERTP